MKTQKNNFKANKNQKSMKQNKSTKNNRKSTNKNNKSKKIQKDCKCTTEIVNSFNDIFYDTKLNFDIDNIVVRDNKFVDHISINLYDDNNPKAVRKLKNVVVLKLTFDISNHNSGAYFINECIPAASIIMNEIDKAIEKTCKKVRKKNNLFRFIVQYNEFIAEDKCGKYQYDVDLILDAPKNYNINVCSENNSFIIEFVRQA